MMKILGLLFSLRLYSRTETTFLKFIKRILVILRMLTCKGINTVIDTRELSSMHKSRNVNEFHINVGSFIGQVKRREKKLKS